MDPVKALVSANWDKAYKGGKYSHEEPILFVRDIIDVIIKEGLREGQLIHFYSAKEIHALTTDHFDIVMPLREEFITREDGTRWAQWETILKKR